jgi:23S rRNA (pseudouridine1915-N3)-methyltransferase
MRIKVLWVGKTQEEWIKQGIEEYAGRIRRYCPLEISEAKEEKGGLPDLMRQREGDRLARLIPGNARLVLLDERGEGMTSVDFSSFLAKSRDTGTQELAFAIGGAYGFSEGFRNLANRTIALSSMTLTHQMVRVFLLEQIYRGFTIINNEQYHH